MNSNTKKRYLFIMSIFVRIVFFIFYNCLLYRIIKSFCSHIYIMWKTNNLKKVGQNVFITYPVEIGGEDCISIGANTSVGKNAIIVAWKNYGKEVFFPSIEIGNNVIIGDSCHITSCNKIKIGNGVLMGRRITITDNAHGNSDLASLKMMPVDRTLISKGPVIIDDNVWIGDKVTILPNVHIGRNVIIGANSVVTKDVPDNFVIGGIPAKRIKIIK